MPPSAKSTAAGSAIHYIAVIFQLESKGLDGEVRPFSKPWFTTFQSAIACSLCLIQYSVSVWCTKKDTERRLQESGQGESTPTTPRSAGAGSDLSTSLSRPLLAAESGNRRVLRQMSAAEREEVIRVHVPRGGTPYHKAMRFDRWVKGEYGVISWWKVMKLILPAMLLQTTLGVQGMGLRYTTASVSQMIMGSCIVFTALLSVWILKRKLNWMHWAGIWLCLFGVAIVSASTFLVEGPELTYTESAYQTVYGEGAVRLRGSGYTMSETMYGIIVTTLGSIIQALQMIVEEGTLQDLHLHPLQVVGWEGVLSTVTMVLITLPLLQLLPGPDVGSCQENLWDTLAMLRNSGPLFTWATVYFWSIFGTNLYGVLITSSLGSVMRAVLLTARTALVWVVGLFLYYLGIGGGSIGESWDSLASPVEAIGFVVLLLGTVLYSQGSSVVMQKAQELTKRVNRQATLMVHATASRSSSGVMPLRETPAAAAQQVAAAAAGPSASWQGEVLPAMSLPPKLTEKLVDRLAKQRSIKGQWSEQLAGDVAGTVKRTITQDGRVSESSAAMLASTLSSHASWMVNEVDTEHSSFVGAGSFVCLSLGPPAAGQASPFGSKDSLTSSGDLAPSASEQQAPQQAGRQDAPYSLSGGAQPVDGDEEEGEELCESGELDPFEGLTAVNLLLDAGSSELSSYDRTEGASPFAEGSSRPTDGSSG